MQDLRQSNSYAEYMRLLGWGVEKIDNSFCYIKKIPLLGVVIKIQRPESVIRIDKIIKLIRKYKAVTLYMESSDKVQHSYFLGKGGFKESNSISLPSKTININLLHSRKELLSSLHPKTRYNIGLSERKKVNVLVSKDIDTFADLWQRYSKSWGMYLPQQKEIRSLYKAFAGSATILIAKKDKDILGGVLLLSTKETTYYMYAFSSQTGKKLFAPTLLVWRGILIAKKSRKKVFDFGGIYDQRYPIKSWLGFSKFKKGFGGEEVEFPGVLVKSLLPFGITF